MRGLNRQGLSRRAVRSFTTGILVLLAVSAISKAQIDTASIVGTIKDLSRAVVATARIPVKNDAPNESQTAPAGDNALYSFPYPRVGTCSVSVAVEAFETAVRTGGLLNVQVRK